MGNTWIVELECMVMEARSPSHALTPAVDEPLSAVQNASHGCLYLFASAGYSTVPSPTDSDALCSLSRSLLRRNVSSNVCLLCPDLVSGDRGSSYDSIEYSTD